MSTMRIKRLLSAALFGALALTGLAACSGANEASSSVQSWTGGVAATVDGAEIMEDDVTGYIESYRENAGLTEEADWGNYLASMSFTPETLREEVINYYVDKDLVEKGAEEKGVGVTDEELEEQIAKMRANFDSDEAWAAALEQAGTTEEEYRSNVREQMVTQRLQNKLAEEAEPLSDEELLTYVQMYADYFSGAKRSSHILFRVEDTTDEAAMAEAKEKAQGVLDRINSGELSFEDAVTEYSDDTSKDKGGDVGWDLLQNFVTEYTDALGELTEDQPLSGVVESAYGYHIIKLTDSYTSPEGGVTSLDQVPEELVEYIRTMMESSAGTTAYSEWITAAEESADIVINDMPEGLPYDLDIAPYEAALEEELSEEELLEDEDIDSSGDVAEGSSEDVESSGDEGASSDAEGADAADEQPAEISSEAEPRSSEAA